MEVSEFLIVATIIFLLVYIVFLREPEEKSKEDSLINKNK